MAMALLPASPTGASPGPDRPRPAPQPVPLRASCPRLAALAAQFEVFVLDIWGVLIDGQRCLPGVPQALRGLLDIGRSVVLVSNSSRRSGEITQMLCAMGLDCAARLPVLSSGELAYEAVRSDWAPARARLWVLGRQPGSSWIQSAGCALAQGPEAADALFAWGLVDEDFEARCGQRLQDAARRGLPLLCSNPDRVVSLGGQLHVGAGALAAHYEHLGGPVRWFGKPDPQVIHRAVALAGPAPLDRVVVIGDSLDTDMAGAHAAGCAAVWVAPEGPASAAPLALHAVFRCFAC